MIRSVVAHPFNLGGGLQKKIYQELVEVLHAPSDSFAVHSMLARRITKLFAPYEIHHNSVNLDRCIISLNLISGPSRVRVVKTWLNGWATTDRIKGDFRRSCLLGCPGEADSLAHYLMCPRVFASVKFVVNTAHEDPLIRVGLRSGRGDPASRVSPQNREALLITSCMFHAYHAL